MAGSGKLTFFCGKMGAGKSTYAKQLSRRSAAILLSEDQWLSELYPNQIESFDDYLRLSQHIKPQMRSLVLQLLAANNHVVMDFPANTKKQRQWFRKLIDESAAAHQLVFIDRDNDTCLKQLDKRRHEEPNRNNTDTPDMFALVTSFFESPSPAENFDVLVE